MSLSAGVLFPDRTRVPGRTMVACALAVAIAAGIAEYYGLSRALSLHVKVHYGVLGGKSWTFYDPVWNEGKGWYAAIIGLNAAFGLILSCCALNQFRARARLSFALRATPMVVALLLLEVKSTSRAADANYAFGVQYLYNGWAVLELVLLAAMGAAAAVLIWREIRERRRFS